MLKLSKKLIIRHDEKIYASYVLFQTPRKKKTRHSSNPPVESHVGWIMDAREHRPSRSRNNSMSQR